MTDNEGSRLLIRGDGAAWVPTLADVASAKRAAAKPKRKSTARAWLSDGTATRTEERRARRHAPDCLDARRIEEMKWREGDVVVANLMMRCAQNADERRQAERALAAALRRVS